MGYRSDVALCLNKEAYDLIKSVVLDVDTQTITDVDKKESIEQVKDLLKRAAICKHNEGATEVMYLWIATKWYDNYLDIKTLMTIIEDQLDTNQYLFIRIGEEIEDNEQYGEYWDNPFDMTFNRTITYRKDRSQTEPGRSMVGLGLSKTATEKLKKLMTHDIELTEFVVERATAFKHSNDAASMAVTWKDIVWDDSDKNVAKIRAFIATLIPEEYKFIRIGKERYDVTMQGSLISTTCGIYVDPNNGNIVTEMRNTGFNAPDDILQYIATTFNKENIMGKKVKSEVVEMHDVYLNDHTDPYQIVIHKLENDRYGFSVKTTPFAIIKSADETVYSSTKEALVGAMRLLSDLNYTPKLVVNMLADEGSVAVCNLVGDSRAEVYRTQYHPDEEPKYAYIVRDGRGNICNTLSADGFNTLEEATTSIKRRFAVMDTESIKVGYAHSKMITRYIMPNKLTLEIIITNDESTNSWTFNYAVRTEDGNVLSDTLRSDFETFELMASEIEKLYGMKCTLQGMPNQTDASHIKPKAMISQPMKGLSKQQILNTRKATIDKLEALGFDYVDTVFDFDKDNNPTDVEHQPVYALSKSIEAMSKCAMVYFLKDWNNARGCQMEHAIAARYGLAIMYEE